MFKKGEVIVIVFGRGDRRYVKRCSLKAAKKYPGRCARKESIKAELEGYRVLPIFDFDNSAPGVFLYAFNYEPIEPVTISL